MFGDPSQYGAPALSARNIIDSDRFRELDRRQSYYDCTNHDQKRYDFDGRVIAAGTPSATQPLLSSERAPFYVPLKMRRPSSPYRLARVIVSSFTNMIFGEQRFPSIRVEGDPATQDFAQALVRASSLPLKMVRARNIGGSTGTVGVSWAFINGKPRVEVHNGKHLFVHEWEDRESTIPKLATECYLFSRDEWSQEKKKWGKQWFWYRRDWTPTADIVYREARFEQRQEPVWIVDRERSVPHDDGECHLHWIQNLPSDEVDGLPDYEGLYESFDIVDILYSTIVRGTVLNLDPTVKLRMDGDQIRLMGLKKGSDNALITGKDGDAQYMEMTGSGIDAGLRVFESKRRSVLEVAQCIIADPASIAAQGVSAVALRTIYAPMLAKCDVIREQYGSAITRLVDQMVRVARSVMGRRVVVQAPSNSQDQGDGVASDLKDTTHEVELEVRLPPRVERTQVLDDDGKPTGEEKITRVPRVPGEGGDVDLRWGPYFIPTPDDQSKTSVTLQAATGGKAFLSKQTATEIMASMYGHEPDEEWRRVNAADVEAAAAGAAMFGDAGAVGGEVGAEGELPEGATPNTESAEHKAVEINLAPTDLAKIIKVNEARAAQGLGPIDDGELTIAEFSARHATTIAKASNADAGVAGPPPKPATPK